MAKQTIEQSQQVLRDWLATVNSMVENVDTWSNSQQWSTHRDEKEIHEDRLGVYRVPWLRISTPNGEIHLDPVARYVGSRAEGRIDLEAWPFLNRVMLLHEAGLWTIMTDSGVPIRQDWNEQTYVQLVKDLLAVQ